jgi:YD repeat-containing protein
MNAVLSNHGYSSFHLFAGGLAMVAAGSAFAGSATYTYDNLGRVTRITYSNGVVITYTYDASGNRIAVITTGAPT